MDRLSQWINAKVHKDAWKPLQATREGIRVSHLMFADDIILFAEALTDQIDCIKEGLSKFCKASGQCVNLNKSSIYFSPNLAEQITRNLSARMEVHRINDLGVYLGHQLVHLGNKRRVFDGLLQGARQQLNGWKSKWISREDRVTWCRRWLIAWPFSKCKSRDSRWHPQRVGQMYEEVGVGTLWW